MYSDLFLKKYNLIKDSNPILSIDFQLKEYSFGDLKNTFLQDYLSLTQFLPGFSRSEFYFDLAGSEILFTKDHVSRSQSLMVDGVAQDVDLFTFLTSKLGVTIDLALWRSRFIDFSGLKDDEAIQRLKQFSLSKEDTSDPLEGRTEEEKALINKAVKIKKEIKDLDKKISNYQNSKVEREELEKKMATREQQRTILNDKKASVDKLLQDKAEVEEKLSGLETANSIEISDSERQKVLQNRLSEQKTIGKKAEVTFRDSVRIEDRAFKGTFLVPLLIVQIILTFLLFLTSKELVVLISGLICVLVIVATAFILNFTNSDDSSFDIEISPDFVSSEPQPALQNNDDQKFVNAAIVNALKLELQNINSSIQLNLGGMTYEEFEKEIQKFDSEEGNSTQLNNDNSQEMSAEDYYKARRELDILKIDEENIQYSKDVKIDMALVETLAGDKPVVLGLPVIAINPIANVVKDFRSVILIQ